MYQHVRPRISPGQRPGRRRDPESAVGNLVDRPAIHASSGSVAPDLGLVGQNSVTGLNSTLPDHRGRVIFTEQVTTFTTVANGMDDRDVLRWCRMRATRSISSTRTTPSSSADAHGHGLHIAGTVIASLIPGQADLRGRLAVPGTPAPPRNTTGWPDLQHEWRGNNSGRAADVHQRAPAARGMRSSPAASTFVQLSNFFSGNPAVWRTLAAQHEHLSSIFDHRRSRLPVLNI